MLARWRKVDHSWRICWTCCRPWVWVSVAFASWWQLSLPAASLGRASIRCLGNRFHFLQRQTWFYCSHYHPLSCSEPCSGHKTLALIIFYWSNKDDLKGCRQPNISKTNGDPVEFDLVQKSCYRPHSFLSVVTKLFTEICKYAFMDQ